jgi:hypothetical protein
MFESCPECTSQFSTQNVLCVGMRESRISRVNSPSLEESKCLRDTRSEVRESRSLGTVESWQYGHDYEAVQALLPPRAQPLGHSYRQLRGRPTTPTANYEAVQTVQGWITRPLPLSRGGLRGLYRFPTANYEAVQAIGRPITRPSKLLGVQLGGRPANGLPRRRPSS